MERKKSLIRNYLYNFIKTFSALFFPVVSFSYSSRILGEAGLGKASFANSLVSYFTLFAMLGMNYYGTREAAKRRDYRDELSKFAHEMLLINGFTTGISYSLLMIVMLTVPQLQEYRVLIWINSFTVILNGLGMEWLYQGIEEYRYIAARSVLFQVFALAAMFFFLRDSGDIAIYAVIHLAATSGSYILNFINARKYIHIHRYEHYEIKKHLKPLLWLFAIPLTIELYVVLDTTMLGFLQGDVAVGRYTAATKVARMVNSLIVSIGVVLAPRLSYYIGKSENLKVKELATKAYNYVSLLSVPAAVGIFMLSDEIIQLFSGTGFSAAGLTIRILSPIIIFIPLSMSINQYTLAPMGKEKRIILSTSAGAVTNILLNSILIPKYAENGAAVATVIAELVVLIIALANAGSFFDIQMIFKHYYQYWLAVFPIPLLKMLLTSMPIYGFLRVVCIIVCSAGGYFLLLLLLHNPYAGDIVQVIKSNLGKTTLI